MDKTISLVTGNLVVSARRVRRKRKTRDRTWQRRQKVSSCTSKDFPWEIVLRHLQDHPRSLILLQMTDKNLRQVITTDHLLWAGIYRKHFYYKAYTSVQVTDPRFPALRLFKEGLTGAAFHVGGIPGDADPEVNTPEFKTAFTAYARQWYALYHGTRCGMCGCRYRHEIYWSLKMRVCKLCVAQNSISDAELFDRYGLAYSEILPRIMGKVFYFQLACSASEDRIAHHTLRPVDVRNRMSHHMFWLPHMRSLFDLEKERRSKEERRRAAEILCGYARKAWIFRQRVALSSLKSIDCFVFEAYRNEKRRALWQPVVYKGGPEWAVKSEWLHRCGFIARHTRRTGEGENVFYRRFYNHSDRVV